MHGFATTTAGQLLDAGKSGAFFGDRQEVHARVAV
jgi:hypothetical protein